MNHKEAMDFILGLSDYERSPSEALAPARYNLERVRRLLELLGDPQGKLKCIHVAGTKGKGSTAVMIANVLSAAGYRTGLFTSPHLHDFRERIRIDEHLINEENLADIVTRLRPAVEEVDSRYPDLGRLTTFEVTTALALVHFAEQGAEFAVLEAGLGGRLDATSVVDALVSVITSISLDHTQVLGNTVAEIAREKAGIIKPAGVVICAPQAPEALQAIQEIATLRQARFLVVGREYSVNVKRSDDLGGTTIDVQGLFDRYENVRVPLLGEHQAINATTAVAALDALGCHGVVLKPEQVRAGIANVRWPGRLEVLETQPLLVVDGAHNADSMAKLGAALRGTFHYQRLIVILGTSVDKDIAGMAGQLVPYADLVIVTKSNHPRSAPVERMAAEMRRLSLNVATSPDVPTALRMARSAASRGDLVCGTGSLFVVAEVREAVGAHVKGQRQ